MDISLVEQEYKQQLHCIAIVPETEFHFTFQIRMDSSTLIPLKAQPKHELTR